MTVVRDIVLVPDGEVDTPWLCVVVQHPTGVRYHHQYGGTACRQVAVEGFVVFVDFGEAAFAGLDRLFQVDCGGAGMPREGRGEVVARVRELVDGLTYTVVDGQSWETARVRVDDGRLDELDEAWVPVVTDSGPGYLAWSNSD